MNVEPAPESFTETVGFTTAVDVEVVKDVETDVVVDRAVTVVVVLEPEAAR